jgi:hypothetical protein
LPAGIFPAYVVTVTLKIQAIHLDKVRNVRMNDKFPPLRSKKNREPEIGSRLLVLSRFAQCPIRVPDKGTSYFIQTFLVA